MFFKQCLKVDGFENEYPHKKTQQQRIKHQFGISLSYSGLSRAIDSKQIVHDTCRKKGSGVKYFPGP